MTTLFFSFGIAILLTCIVSIFFWSKVKFSWLSDLCTLLILSLPFEYFPRVELGGASWRVSQVLVIIGFWIIAILVFKKDTKLLSHKLHFATWYLLVFLILSTPSWFLVQDLQRFIVHLVGTIFVFGALVLLANFATDIWKNLQKLTLVLFGCSIFGLYQFFGDLIGIPSTFTLLREHYTKAVFGVPRVQGTAVEPLYFAGMLLIAIFVLIFWICERLEMLKNNQQNSCHLEQSERSYVRINKTSEAFAPKKTPVSFAASSLTNNESQGILAVPSPTSGNFLHFILTRLQRVFRYSQGDGYVFLLKYLFLILLTIFVVFLLTISKGTFGVLAILILPLLIVIFFAFNFFRQFIFNHLLQGILTTILVSIILFTIINPLTLLGEIGTNFVETIAGTSASAVERGMFVSEALAGIKQSPFIGIGMGQYGDYVGSNLGSLNEDGKAIVNNVYLEIWLEEGLFALFFFILILIQPVIMLLKKVAIRWSPLHNNMLAALSLVFILVGYYIQWTLFSPIFIMPIFILLGLAYNLIFNDD